MHLLLWVLITFNRLVLMDFLVLISLPLLDCTRTVNNWCQLTNLIRLYTQPYNEHNVTKIFLIFLLRFFFTISLNDYAIKLSYNVIMLTCWHVNMFITCCYMLFILLVGVFCTIKLNLIGNLTPEGYWRLIMYW